MSARSVLTARVVLVFNSHCSSSVWPQVMTVIVIVITTIVQPSHRDSVRASENDLYRGGHS